MMPSLYTTRSGTSSQCSSVWRSRDKPRSNLPHGLRHSTLVAVCWSSLSARPPRMRCSSQCATRRTNVRVWPQILCQVNAEIAEVKSCIIVIVTSSVAVVFGRHGMPHLSVTLTFHHLTLKLVCESHLRWGTFVPNLGLLCLWVLELFAMYATDGQTDGRTKATLIAPFPTVRA